MVNKECGRFLRLLFEGLQMYLQNIDTKLQKRIQSKEFEESVDQAVRSFLYDLDFMLLEDQHSSSGLNYSRIQTNATIEWVNPV